MQAHGRSLRGSTRATQNPAAWPIAQPQLALRPCRAALRRAVRVQAQVGTPQDASVIARRAELVKGCNSVLAELSGLDFPKSEVRKYFAAAVKPPAKGSYEGFEMGRAAAALEKVIKGDTETLDDVQALEVLNVMLPELWRWRRRGKGGWDDSNETIHRQALEALQGQGIGSQQTREEAERVTSVVLDQLDISDSEKRELGRALEQVAFGGIQGAVWGTLGGLLVVLAAFNFLRG